MADIGAPIEAEPRVLFRDARFVVLDKPAGLPSHAGPRGGPSAEDFFPLLSRRKDGPWLAHRLDADTAGCLVVALRKASLVAAQAVFAEGRAEKVYWAIVLGGPDRERGCVDLPLRKVKAASGWRMAGGPGGLAAATAWVVRGRGPGLAWLELRPKTGRTHQIRAHCAALGCPVRGDPVYGDGAGALALLARSIRLPLEPEVAAVAPVPAHMHADLRACGWSEG